MKRFSAQFNDNSFINVPADRMEIQENMVHVYSGTELVALADISIILSARISDENKFDNLTGGQRKDASHA